MKIPPVPDWLKKVTAVLLFLGIVQAMWTDDWAKAIFLTIWLMPLINQEVVTIRLKKDKE